MNRLFFQEIHIGLLNQILFSNPKPYHQVLGHLDTVLGLLSALQNDFDFNEVPEAIDFIKMNACLAGKKQMPSFPHYTHRAQCSGKRFAETPGITRPGYAVSRFLRA